MKKTLLIFSLIFSLWSNAQTWVTIPDHNFASYLSLTWPFVMNGNQLNIESPIIQNMQSLNVCCRGISDLSGIEYFTHLEVLHCYENYLTNLPALPNTLKILSCYSNNLTALPILPTSLITLSCNHNNLSALPTLPDGLKILGAMDNLLTSLPALPASLESLSVGMNQLSTLPTLPENLQGLFFGQNEFTEMPDLPFHLKQLEFYNNQIQSIPFFPDSIQVIDCSFNQLTFLPLLPNSLQRLNCRDNQIQNLPELPATLDYLFCQNNQISCFPVLSQNFINGLLSINITGNLNTCLPNYIPGLDEASLSLPLCVDGDLVNNPNNCPTLSGVFGKVYFDYYTDCQHTTLESKISNIPIKVYDQNDSLLIQSTTLSNGYYNFQLIPGNYRIKMDTSNLPLLFQCNYLDSNITIADANDLISDIDFPLSCKPGFDLAVCGILHDNWVFPGQTHEVKILAGELSQWYGVTCPSGMSGELQVSFSGPVTLHLSSFGNFVPIVTGNILTYTIPDFSEIDLTDLFKFSLVTDTTAQVDDEICITVDVSLLPGENMPSNNHLEYCYQVVNSHDPNIKEVYPVYVEPGYDGYFTYTVHFQNTGNAPAFNIRLLDTLDSNLDLETFQVLNYSHYNTFSINGNQLSFKFPNIMLLDSTTNMEASKGFVQYRIKAKPSLELGTLIKNTAHIYFDYNEAIVTNTAFSLVVQNVSLQEIESKKTNVYPNPFSTTSTINFDEALKDVSIVLRDIYGKEVRTYSSFSGNKLLLERQDLKKGIYFLEVGTMRLNRIKLMILD
jgi:uncharacterized repeat protein (TIGR01451 family)